MVNAAISETVSADMGRRIQPTFGYYRQPNGWLTVSPITRLERVKYIEEGWTHLSQYGAFDMTSYTANHPFDALFMFGGAKEMSVNQLLEAGFYINPPLVPTCRQHITQYHRSHNEHCWIGAQKAQFPQMESVPEELRGPFACEFCERKLPTRAGREQHQSVVHKDRIGDIRTGKSLGESLAKALGNASAPTTQDQMESRIRALEAQLAAQSGNAEQCGCGGSYKPGGETFHKRGRKHRQWGTSNP